MKKPPDPCLLAEVWRSGRVESRHHGAIAVVEDGVLRRAWGDAGARVYARSAVKPLQALPLVERGVAERLGVTDEELVLTSASHDGTEAQVAVVERLLARGGFGAGDLLCGPHAPFDKAAALAIARSGGKPGRLHNNCSGKHAGFLLLGRDLGVAAADYLEPGSASQRLVRATVAEMAGLGVDEVEVGLDGCGAPTFRLPLAALAEAFWRLANPGGLGAVRQRACRRMLQAVSSHPLLLAGKDRLCTALVRAGGGRLYPKNGAEGVYAVGGPGFGLAVKVEDGAQRGYLPVVVELLGWLGVWEEVPSALERFREVPVLNTQKIVVGKVASAVPWEAR